MTDRRAARPRSLSRWLVGPSPRIKGEEERAGAQLLATIALTHLLATVALTAAATAFRRHMLQEVLVWGRLGVILLTSTLAVLGAYVLARRGYYRAGTVTYIVATTAFPLLAPFAGAPSHDVGILTTALIPLVIAGALLPSRWTLVVGAVVVLGVAVQLMTVSWPRGEVVIGFTILLSVVVCSILTAVLHRHQNKLAALRLRRLERSEASLRSSQERVNALLGASRDLVAVLDANGARLAAFGAVAEVTGYDLDQRGPLSHFESIHPDDKERVWKEFAQLLKHPGQTVRTEWRYLHKDGKHRWHEALATNRLGQEGIDGVVVNIRDVTDRRAAEEAVIRNERRYRTLFSTVTDGVFLFSRDGRVIEVNDAACRMLGYTRAELLCKRLEDLAPADKAEHTAEINRQVAEKGHLVFTAAHRRKDGSIYPVEVAVSMIELDGAPVFMGVARDITERVRAEEERARLESQLQHAVKMESVGRLAGGVAHDFNNLLTAILGNVDLALAQVHADGDLKEALTEIRDAALSAASVTRQLLAFSRKQVFEPRALDINDLIRRMHKMLERVIGEDIRLRTVAGVGLGTVRVDPGLIEQSLVNLVVNARDVMPSGGDLVIATENVVVSPDEAPRLGLRTGGRHVLISIADTGSGMSDEVKRHLFEPFFTTKPRGMGTGLGLAMTYGVVQQCGGGVDVISKLGHGTTFRIYLPIVEGPAELMTPHPSNEVASRTGGSETILIVEDDARVREMAVQSLRADGYQVLVAASGEEALAIARSRNIPIHLLLTDVVMPGMNGRELATQLAESNPETRTLFTSGYGEDIIARGGLLDAGIDFLAKPYTPHLLARRVREVLDRT